MAPVGSDRPAGRRPARWAAVAAVALVPALPVATWWWIGPLPYDATRPVPPRTMVEQVVGIPAAVVAAGSAVALAAAALIGRTDRRWWPTLAALSVAGFLAGLGVRTADIAPEGNIGAAMLVFFIVPTVVVLVIYALVHIPRYWPRPER
jgi:hypothetical protein